MKQRYFWIFGLISALVTTVLSAQETGSRIELVRASEAEYITLEEGTDGILILRGGILLRMQNRLLKAETVKINPATGEFFGEGGVTLVDGEQTMRGERFIFNNKTGIGIIYNAAASFDARYFSGEAIKVSDKESYIARNAFFTSCELVHPHFMFKASKIWFYKDNQMVAVNVIYQTGQTPVFYWPVVFQTDFGTGIVTQYGNNLTKGHFLQNTYHFGITSDQERFYVPNRGSLMFDWYQKGGMFTGARLLKTNNRLKYDIDLGVADYRQLDTVNDIGGELIFTNQVRQTDGSRREVHEFWWKAKTDIAATWNRSRQDDRQSSLSLRFEKYRHKNFMQEFGYRYQPTNTFDALYRNRFFQAKAGYENINWEAAYSENWGENSFSLQVLRSLRWYEFAKNADSTYLPVYDMMPKVSYSRRMELLRPESFWFGGLIGDVRLNGTIHRYYADGREIKTIYTGDGMATANLYYNLLPWLHLNPGGGLGFFSTHSTQDIEPLQREAARRSYQYLFTRNTLRAGYPLLNHQSIHHLVFAFNEGIRDPTFGQIREHYWQSSLTSDVFSVATFNITTARDLRLYPYYIPEAFRWSDIIARAGSEYDFIHGFAGSVYGLNKRNYRHFMGVSVNNTYSYLTRFERPAYNDFNLNWRMGGYKLPLIKELLLVRTGVTLHQNFLNDRGSNLLFSWDTDLQVHRDWRLLMGGNSRSEQFDRYAPGHPQSTTFTRDFFQSINPFSSRDRQETSLNIENFYADLEHDLHRWLLRLSYLTRQRTVYFGPQLRNRLAFYEHTFFFSLTLKDLGGFGIPRTELYRENPTDR